MSLKSRTFTKFLWQLFPMGAEEEERMSVQMARMAVAYEDLFFELNGAVHGDKVKLGHHSEAEARLYFVRRALGSAWEIQQAVHALQMNGAFKRFKATLEPGQLNDWHNAVGFFEANKKFLKAWRNDLAGHFTDEAAQHGLEELVKDEKAGLIELYDGPWGITLHLGFAADIVAASMSKERDEGEAMEDFLRRALGTAHDAQLQAIKAVRVASRRWLK